MFKQAAIESEHILGDQEMQHNKKINFEKVSYYSVTIPLLVLEIAHKAYHLFHP